MPDSTGKHYASKQWLTQKEGCGGIIDLLDLEQMALEELLKNKLSPKVEGQLRPALLVENVINVQGHAPT